MRKRRIIKVIMVVLVGLLLTACGNDDNSSSSNSQQPDSSLALAVGLNGIGNDDMYEILNDRSGEGIFVYIGTSTCPNCREFQPIVTEVLEDLNKGLRHYEADTAQAYDDVSQMAMFDILMELIENSNWEGNVPVILYMIDGQVIDFLLGLNPQENVIEFFERNGGLR